MQTTNMTIEGIDFTIPKWPMSKQIQHNHVVMPLLRGSIVNALSMLNEGMDEALFIAAVADGVLESLSSIDLFKVSEILLDGIGFRNSKGVMATATIDALDNEGHEISVILSLIVNVIKINYGSLLKKDFSESVMGILNSQEES